MKWRNSGGEFVQPPTGTFLARCVRLTDLGTQTSEYEGTTRVRRQVLIGWELPEELMTTGEAAGQPFLTSKFYTQSLHENATLRKDLINWRGRDFTDEELEGFDAKNILGHPCMLTLTDVKGKVRVTSVTSVPRSVSSKMPKQINPSFIFSLDPGEYTDDAYQALSDGIRKIVDLSPEMAAIRNGGNGKLAAPNHSDIEFGAGEDDDGSIPF
jgi:hypothetical protein